MSLDHDPHAASATSRPTHDAPAGEPLCFRGTRKTTRAGEALTPPVEVRDGVWHIRSLPMIRQVLRESGSVTQAGFNAEAIESTGMRKPVLYQDGEPHRAMRSGIARFFAPKTVTSRYGDLMEDLADDLVAQVATGGGAVLDDITMRYSVAVAAQVIGLTASDLTAMSRRLEAFFATPVVPATAGPDASLIGRIGSRISGTVMALYGHRSMWMFFLKDVRPAIKVRRASPGEDVISHCLAQGYTATQILIECVTYGAAGMVTTREFISMATWHLLEDPALRERYLSGDKQQRYAVLQEILRLEPIVGHLYRRTSQELTLTDGPDRHVVPAGALLDLYIRGANADPGQVGAEPLRVCPGRPLPPRISGEVLSFGDGPHKCPGSHIALQETDILLQRLLRLPLVIEASPTIGWDDLIAGYELRGLRLAMAGAA